MVRTTKAQHQAEYLEFAHNLFEYVFALEEDEDDKILLDDEDFELEDLNEIIELSALEWTRLALAMSGDGTRGPYNQFPKSIDFFTLGNTYILYFTTLVEPSNVCTASEVRMP
jgi:hypothetical protein